MLNTDEPRDVTAPGNDMLDALADVGSANELGGFSFWLAAKLLLLLLLVARDAVGTSLPAAHAAYASSVPSSSAAAFFFFISELGPPQS